MIDAHISLSPPCFAKPVDFSGQYGLKSVTAHEAGHTLDTHQKKYSSTAEWQIISKDSGAKIYPTDGKSSMEVFAGAVAKCIADPAYL